VQSDARGAGVLTLDTEGGSLKADLTFADGVAEAAIAVPDARLWCPDDPYLYTLTVTLVEEEQVIDRYALEVGIRTIAVEGDQILLNGEPIFLTGFGRHEDFPVHGRGLNMPLIVKDYALLKWVGANSYRTAHYPYAEEQMRMADREGILVIDEIPAVGLSFDDGEENISARLARCKQQIAELVARDKNHPSVIMWSVANEPFPPNMRRRSTGGDSGDSDGVAIGTAFFEGLFALVRELDPTRPATVVGFGVGMATTPAEWLALSDVVCINRYWGWYTQGGQIDVAAASLAQDLDGLHDQLGKPIVITEFGADTIAGMHSDPPEMWTEEYQVAFLRAYLDVAAERPYIAGLHVWNFADFKTAQGARRAGGLNHKGVFTRDRRPKMAAHFLRERWTKDGAHVPPAAATAQPAEATEAPAPGFREVLSGLARKLAEKGFDRAMTIQFDLGEAGVYRLVMAEEGSCRVAEGAGEATATLRMAEKDAIDLLRGTLSPRLAFARGKVKVEGDLGALMALRELR
jgi:beta-glucuronidase